MINIEDYSQALSKNDLGIWQSQHNESVSYPEDGNEGCFKVEDHSFWFQHRNTCIIEVVKNFYSAGSGPIFDIGGGNGYVSKALQDNGFEVTLVEPGAGVLNAKTRGITHIIQSTFRDADFFSSSLPAAALFDVLEHIGDDIGFLIEIREKLLQDGKLFITVPAYNFLWSQADVNAFHYRRYSIGSLSKILGESGFHIRFASYFFSFLLLPIFTLRTIPYMFFPGSKQKKSGKWKNHHSIPPIALKLVNLLCSREYARLHRKKKIGFGASIIAIASKQRMQKTEETILE